MEYTLESADINAVVGESARIEVSEAINYIKTGQKEISEAVLKEIASFDSNTHKKISEFNANYTEKKALIDAQVDRAEEDASIATTQAQTATVQASSATASATRASNYAAEAMAWAIGDPSEPAGNSSKYWAEYAEQIAGTIGDPVNKDLSNLSATGELKFSNLQSQIDDNAGYITALQGDVSQTQQDIDVIEAKIPSTASSSNKLTDKSYVDTQDSHLQTQINAKQDAVSDLAIIRLGAQAGATALQSGDNISELTNDTGYITEINANDVTTALGYTPYNSTNPNGYQANVLEGLQVNGSDQTITNKKVNIFVPTNNTQLANGAGYITSSALTPYVLSADLATVATSGSYTDLNNKPVIPTVNNATLTIQKNGTDVAVFSANASTNVTANINVPNPLSSVSASSTNADAVGAKLFYDTCGDIETLINSL